MLCIYVIAGIFVYLILRFNSIDIKIIRYISFVLALSVLLNILKVDFRYHIVFLCMSGIIICDLRYYIIPDSFHLLLLINRLIFIGNVNELYSCMFNALAVASTVYVISIVLKYLLKKQTIGGGDIKLLFSLGVYCSYMVNVCCLMISCVLALVSMFVCDKKMIAFGPYICLGYILYMIPLR